MKNDKFYRLYGLLGLILLGVWAGWQELKRFQPQPPPNNNKKDHDHGDPKQHGNTVKSTTLHSKEKSLVPSGRLIAGKREVTYTAFQYGFKPDPLVLKSKEQIVMKFNSADVKHGMMIPAIDLNVTIPAGASKIVRFTAPEKPGKYPVFCSVFCGSSHGDMKGTLIVLPQQPEEKNKQSEQH